MYGVYTMEFMFVITVVCLGEMCAIWSFMCVLWSFMCVMSSVSVGVVCTLLCVSDACLRCVHCKVCVWSVCGDWCVSVWGVCTVECVFYK